MRSVFKRGLFKSVHNFLFDHSVAEPKKRSYMFSSSSDSSFRFLLVLSFILLCQIFPGAGIPGAAGEEYIIGPEDVLEISVWKDEALTRVVVVRPDGKISFPLVGELSVGGKTVDWVKQQISDYLSGYMSEVEVTVSVNQVNSIRVYLLGKVARPGEYRIGRGINVIQALALAGGLAPFADEDDILILRTKNDGSQQKIPFNYKAVKRGEDLAQNIFLLTGDVVIVP